MSSNQIMEQNYKSSTDFHGDSTVDGPQLRRIVTAAFIGTALEWYDFFLFGTAAAIVIAPLFFPGNDPTLSLISAFLSFGVGFIARPIGAAIFGHVGDRYGRRPALIATLALMGAATTMMGLLPTHASVGVWAPVLLTMLRFAQGIAAGGEWGGATLLAIEYAPKQQRNFCAAMVQLGSPAGTLLSAGAMALAASLSGADFLVWGWRVPFLVSIVLLGTALWLRVRVEETPTFKLMAGKNHSEKLPVIEMFRQAPSRLAIGMATYLACTAGFFVVSTFMVGYVTRTLQLPSTWVMQALMAGAIVQMVVVTFAGRLADKIGGSHVVVIGYWIALALAFPIFFLVDTGNHLLIVLGVSLGVGVSFGSYAAIGPVLAQLFPVRLQYSGIALSATLAGVVSGFTPALATWCLSLAGGKSWGPALLLFSICLISLIGAYLAREVLKRDAR